MSLQTVNQEYWSYGSVKFVKGKHWNVMNYPGDNIKSTHCFHGHMLSSYSSFTFEYQTILAAAESSMLSQLSSHHDVQRALH